MFQSKHLGSGGGSSFSLSFGGFSSISSLAFSLGLIGLSIDSNLDSNGSAANLFALEELNSLLLLLLTANVNETVALGLAGLPPATTNNTSRVDLNTGLGEQGAEASIIDGEAEVGDEEHRLGGLSSGVFTSGTLRTRGTGLASLLLGGCLATFSRGRTVGGSTFASSFGTLRLALFENLLLVKIDAIYARNLYLGSFLLLGLRSLISRGSSTFSSRLLGVAVGLSFGNLARDSLAATTTRPPLGFPLLLLFLVSRFGDLDDHLAAFELLLVEEFNCFLCSFSTGKGYESIAR